MDTHLGRAGALIFLAAAAYIVLPTLQASTYNRYNTTGFVNPGNDCYANSIIQALSALSNLKDWLTDNRNAPFTVSLTKILKEVSLEFQGAERSISVRPLLRTLESARNARFTRGQHDAHEFLVYVLDALEENAGAPSPFIGTLVEKIRCTTCKFEFERSEIFRVLEVQPDEKLLEFKPEFIEEYRCEHCKQLTTIQKTSSVKDFPPILVVHINRSSKEGGLIFKSQKSSHIPVQLGSYRLQSVIFHHGNHNFGHYTCARRKLQPKTKFTNTKTKQWWQISNTYVKEASEKQITSRQKDAYIFFYEKTDWLRAMSSKKI